MKREDALAARLLCEFGFVLTAGERGAEASALLEAGLTIAEAIEDWGLCYELLTLLAWSKLTGDDLVVSTRCYERAFALRPRLGTDRPAASNHRLIRLAACNALRRAASIDERRR